MTPLRARARGAEAHRHVPADRGRRRRRPARQPPSNLLSPIVHRLVDAKDSASRSCFAAEAITITCAPRDFDDLDGRGDPHFPGPGVHEHPLPRLRLHDVDQALPRGRGPRGTARLPRRRPAHAAGARMCREGAVTELSVYADAGRGEPASRRRGRRRRSGDAGRRRRPNAATSQPTVSGRPHCARPLPAGSSSRAGFTPAAWTWTRTSVPIGSGSGSSPSWRTSSSEGVLDDRRAWSPRRRLIDGRATRDGQRARSSTAGRSRSHAEETVRLGEEGARQPRGRRRCRSASPSNGTNASARGRSARRGKTSARPRSARRLRRERRSGPRGRGRPSGDCARPLAQPRCAGAATTGDRAPECGEGGDSSSSCRLGTSSSTRRRPGRVPGRHRPTTRRGCTTAHRDIS